MRVHELPTLLERIRADLAGTPRQLVGEVTTPRVLGIPRAERVALRDEAWHLGVLLVSPDALYATGEIVRSQEPVPRGYTAAAQRERAERAHAAFRGGVVPGTAVHLGWRLLPTSEQELRAAPEGERAPLVVDNDTLRVRWSAAAASVDLAAYLTERATLLRETS